MGVLESIWSVALNVTAGNDHRVFLGSHCLEQGVNLVLVHAHLGVLVPHEWYVVELSQAFKA